ncbi:MAG TPA: CerR family C-terminal domain-containing protein [Candidatus Adamsella sp.]|nr:CerR family C-terminal domain-containing protein [Candidatus Adamsella sp.]
MKQKFDENSKEKILNTAIKLFAQKGFDGTSIREICKSANINICMISYYFGGKQELYQEIISNLIESQKTYMESFLDVNEDFSNKSKKELIEKLQTVLEKFIDYFYSNISNDLIAFLVKEQQKSDFEIKPPAIIYLRRLVAAILDKPANDKEVIFKVLFLISQINSPKILTTFSLKVLNQTEFTDEDIQVIKNNIKTYVKATFGDVDD